MRKIRVSMLYVCALIVTICLSTSQMFYVNVKAADDANYTNMTIYAKDNQGNVIGSMTGMFTKGTKLIMENNPSKLGYGDIARNYFALRDFTGNKNTPNYDVFTYGVNIVNGTYKGKIVITFNIDNNMEDYTTGKKVGNKYDGINAKTIVHVQGGKDSFGNDDYINKVNNGKVSFTIDYSPLLERTPFIIGIPLANDPTQTQSTQSPKEDQPSQKQHAQTSYKDMTLYANVKNEKTDAKGNFTKDAVLNVSEIAQDNDSYKKLAASMPNNKIIGAYDVKVTNGSYKGKLHVTFNVDKRYANKDVTIKHLQDDGNIESNTVKVTSDNTVEMTVSSLSPFMIFGEDNSATGLNTQQYIEIGGGIILVIVIIGCTVAIIKSKKRKSQY